MLAFVGICREWPDSREACSRFPSNPIIMRVSVFLMFWFNKETPPKKGKNDTTGVPTARRSQVKIGQDEYCSDCCTQLQEW